MLQYIKTSLFKTYEKLKNTLKTVPKPNILILNLSLSDRIFISDLIYENKGVSITYEKNQGSTTKFSEMVTTTDFKCIFYKQQFFMESSLKNYLEFSNGSRLQLCDIDGLIFMMNLKNLKSLKYSSYEIYSILKCFSAHPANLKIVLFNGPRNGYIDIKEFEKLLDLNSINAKFEKEVSCYLCDFNKNLDDFNFVVSELLKIYQQYAYDEDIMTDKPGDISETKKIINNIMNETK